MDTIESKIGDIPMLILAGGFGTRLSAVVKDVPKPLAPINGKPFLEYVLKRYYEQGIRKFIFLAHHMADLLAGFIEQEKKIGLLQNCEVQIVVEPTPLGTGGAVANAVKELNLNSGFIITNADTWLESGIAQLQENQRYSIAVVSVENTSRYGSVRISNGVVQAFEEKKPESESGYINAGMYFLDAEVFRNWDGNAFSIEKDLFPKLIEEKKLNAEIITGNFIDIGIPEDYYRFERWIELHKTEEL